MLTIVPNTNLKRTERRLWGEEACCDILVPFSTALQGTSPERQHARPVPLLLPESPVGGRAPQSLAP